MANPEHLEILEQGVEVWNEWRNENKSVYADLREANFSELDLTGRGSLRYIPCQGTEAGSALASGAESPVRSSELLCGGRINCELAPALNPPSRLRS
jgi:hypothetical protein